MEALQDIKRRLSDNALAVCRHYLPSGTRAGRYWIVGDVENTPGRSLYVRLTDAGAGRPAGAWTDAESGAFGDLLDLIAANRRLASLPEALEEARRFLALPRTPDSVQGHRSAPGPSLPAQRLFGVSRPIAGTLADRYVRGRHLTELSGCRALRFYPRCWYRGDRDEPQALPALLAAVTDEAGAIVGLQRTYLDPATGQRASVRSPKRAMGPILGHGARIGGSGLVIAAGEGLETVLSLRVVLPELPVVACGPAGHLAAFKLPSDLNRLYIAEDQDLAGRRASTALAARAHAAGVEVVLMRPALKDFNEDLVCLGVAALHHRLSSTCARRPGSVANPVLTWTPLRSGKSPAPWPPEEATGPGPPAPRNRWRGPPLRSGPSVQGDGGPARTAAEAALGEPSQEASAIP